MIYGSVCSGIEAASVAWHPLGWRAKWFSEIADFPSRVLAARWPEVPNLGDFTKIGSEHGPIDVLVGGTPCQSFSVGGRRAGLDDPRGVLALEFLRLARRVRARWIVWENVPGALASSRGEDIRDILGAFVDAGYGLAWRVLDAQRFGVPQRRRRLFAVGYLGDWRPSVAVLFERPRVHGNPATRRGEGSQVAPPTDGGADPLVAGTLTASDGRRRGSGANPSTLIAKTLTAHHDRSADNTYVIQDATRARDNAQNGIGVAGPDAPSFTLATRSSHAIAFHASQDPISSQVFSPSLGRKDTMGVMTFDGQITSDQNRARCLPDSPAPTLSATTDVKAIAMNMRPRRLTPREWERLQGFPDDYTAIQIGKHPAKDTPRYQALGNSMAVPVMRWIGERIELVDQLVDFG